MKIGISKRDYKCLKPHKIGDLRIDDNSFIFALLHFQKIVHHKYDIKVFQECISRSTHGGGFDWNATSQGFDFWERVVGKEDFAYFFKKYKP